MSTAQPRRPAGAPTGGQFAGMTRPEPGYDLEAGPAADVERAASGVRSGRRELGAATVDGRPVEPEILVLGDGTRIERYYRDGSLHDPDDGRPAVAWARAGGTVAREVHYRDRRLHDPAGGRPADVFYRPDGSVEREAHYRDGECQDPVDGRPAIVQYGDDGTVSASGTTGTVKSTTRSTVGRRSCGTGRTGPSRWRCTTGTVEPVG